MNRMQKVGCCLLGLALATFALPSVAGNDKKQYTLEMRVPDGQTTAPFNVEAKITNKGNSTINSFSVTLIYGGQIVVDVTQPASGNATHTKSTVSVKNMRPLKSDDSFTVMFKVNTSGDGHWGGTAWTGSQLNGQSFGMVLADSVLDASVPTGPAFASGPFSVLDSINPVCVSGERDFYDKNGTAGNAVQIFVTNTLSNINGVLHFRWPDELGLDDNDAAAAFKYTVCGPGSLTQVAWLNTDGGSASTGTPVFISAEDCIEPKVLPTPYGTIVGEGIVLPAPDSEDYVPVTTITVDTLTPDPEAAHGSIGHPSPPFHIVIGSERLKVTNVVVSDYDNDPSDEGEAGEGEDPGLSPGYETWTVTRAVLGTTAASHSGGVLAMSTPLPELTVALPPGSVYANGTQALMCIVSHNPDGSTTFFDIGGDGYHAP